MSKTACVGYVGGGTGQLRAWASRALTGGVASGAAASVVKARFVGARARGVGALDDLGLELAGGWGETADAMRPNRDQSRRHFLKLAGAASAASLAPNLLLGQPSRPKLRFAVVGVGGITVLHHGWITQGGHRVALLCDADERRMDSVNPNIHDKSRSVAVEFPKALRTRDYREVFRNQADSFDAVICGAPDHHHYPICRYALEVGKPIFCEKPLCWSPEEAFELRGLAAKAKLPTQMGNQGNSANGWRVGDGHYQRGDLGEIREVHAWITGRKEDLEPDPLRRFPARPEEIPDPLDWGKWLGPAGAYPYAHGIHPASWRWWLPFGGGEVGDWGCHVFGGIFKTLPHLRFPRRVEVARKTEFNGVQFPAAYTVKWSFPKRDGKPPVDLYFHTARYWDPDFLPPRPSDLDTGRNWPPSRHGCYWKGTKATYLMHEGHNFYGALIPEAKRRELGEPPLRYPKLKGNPGLLHGEHWIEAVRGEREWSDTISNFDYAAHLTAVVQMGNAALKAGRPLRIDPETGWPRRREDERFFRRPDPDERWYPMG